MRIARSLLPDAVGPTTAMQGDRSGTVPPAPPQSRPTRTCTSGCGSTVFGRWSRVPTAGTPENCPRLASAMPEWIPGTVRGSPGVSSPPPRTMHGLRDDRPGCPASRQGPAETFTGGLFCRYLQCPDPPGSARFGAPYRERPSMGGDGEGVSAIRTVIDPGRRLRSGPSVSDGVPRRSTRATSRPEPRPAGRPARSSSHHGASPQCPRSRLLLPWAARPPRSPA